MHITARTRVLGVIGDPVQHSRSPQMHNAAIAALGLDYVYVAFHVYPEELAAAVRGFQALGIAGINATIPHKQALLHLVDRPSREAELIGAVNTLVFTDDGIEGHNTDARGFIAAMEERHLPLPSDAAAFILGAGGAARAIVVALALQGVEPIYIANRTPSRAVELANDLAVRTGVSIQGCGLHESHVGAWLQRSGLLVNTTPVGMHVDDPLLLDPDTFPEGMIVVDIVYVPPETRLIRAARERGHPTLGGLGMLVHQGAIAFQLWTGVEPPVEIMRQALITALEA